MQRWTYWHFKRDASDPVDILRQQIRAEMEADLAARTKPTTESERLCHGFAHDTTASACLSC